jgi:hypothetical protein
VTRTHPADVDAAVSAQHGSIKAAVPPSIAALSLDHGVPAILIGAALVILGQGLTHRYALTRERRKELADAVDRAAAAFALIDRRVAQFAAQVGTRAVPADVQHAADLVARCRG